MVYADKAYYSSVYGGTLPEECIEPALKRASQHIDSLTFNRIVGRGFDSLTEFQQNTIRDVACRLADFEFENEDMINSVLQSYSINGVSMSFGTSWNLVVQNGVAIRRDDYAQLCSTNLCSRCLGVR